MEVRFRLTTTVEMYHHGDDEPYDTDTTVEEYGFYELADLDIYNDPFTTHGAGLLFESSYQDYRTGDTEIVRTAFEPFLAGSVPDDLPPIADERLRAWCKSWGEWLRSFDRTAKWLDSAPFKKKFFLNAKQLELNL